MMAEVILALGIFTIVATSYSKALATLWRTTAYVKEKQVITQIMDSVCHNGSAVGKHAANKFYDRESNI